MYNKHKILTALRQSRAIINKWEQELENIDKDLLKFYKKGQKLAGNRLRRQLKVLQADIQLLRLDIRRLLKEREIFKDTELDKDFKRTKRSDATSK
jgi:hypothetical protein